jgi:hypothetical protein
MAIPPGGRYNKSFFSADSFYYSSSLKTWITRKWIPNNLTGSSFVFTYKINGDEKYIVFSGENSVSNLPASDEILGTVDSEKTFWNFLFLKSPNKRREILHDMALQEAQGKYGNDVRLKNLKYVGAWSPASLLFYFSLLGFVEKATLSADVVK